MYSDTFNIKNTEFLKCFDYIDPNKDIEIYRIMEEVVYGVHKNVEKYKNLLVSLGHEQFILNIKKSINSGTRKQTINEQTTKKRKNIKENMLENFVIKNNKGKNYLNHLQMYIFFKNISNKNITIVDGDIIDIVI